ncbi:MAG TPA: NAD-binding protein [Tenuifilaceae bacterium]|nr:NAD-binding protein [Tenuifilaceae bacterium]HPE18439.1 NAD-binding protein [Tenuifilaceae bacterium]HPJ45647.1 NAD-binding protein [Tenuifilaceae bacterium]HPQ34186.1 NAD-binding protein [Tenuifilaceae bacterium]
MDRANRSAFSVAIILMVTILAIGVLGYMAIEDFSFTEAFYMTIITMGTVGFKEVRTLSVPGMWFTILLIIISLGIFAFALSLITKHFVELMASNLNNNKKVEKKLETVSQHVIVVGYGRNGQQAVKVLLSHRIPVVVIDNKPENIQLLAEIPEILYTQGDATEDKVLLAAGINRARAIITALPNDADNLFVVVTARELNPKIKIISRASSVGNDKKLKIAGASNVIMPDTVGGQRMATLVIQPDILEFIENIMLANQSDVSLVEISCASISERNNNLSIGNLKIREVSGVTILGLKNGDNEYVLNPSPDTLLTPNDMLFVLGSPEQINGLKKLLSENS